MAARLLRLKPVFEKTKADLLNKSIEFFRIQSRIIRAKHALSRHPGFKEEPLSHVNPGNLLYEQLTLKYSPGLNVGIGKIAKLYAKTAGKLIVTSEKTSYKSENIIVQLSFPMYTPTYSKYIHVVPEPMHRRFKLIEKF